MIERIRGNRRTLDGGWNGKQRTGNAISVWILYSLSLIGMERHGHSRGITENMAYANILLHFISGNKKNIFIIATTDIFSTGQGTDNWSRAITTPVPLMSINTDPRLSPSSLPLPDSCLPVYPSFRAMKFLSSLLH